MNALEAQTLITTIPITGIPSSIATTSDGTRAFVADSNGTASVVRIIDLRTNTIIATIDDPRFLSLVTLAITPDDSQVYVVGAGADFVINANTLAVNALPTGSGNFGSIAIMPDGTKVYIGKPPPIGVNATIFVLNPSTNTVITTITLPGNPSFAIADPSSMVIRPDDTRLYVADRNFDIVYVIDTHTDSILSTVSVGDRPEGVAVTNDGLRAFVANLFSDSLSVFDTNTNKLITTIPVGNGPTEVDITPDGCLAFVPNILSSFTNPTDTISIINVAQNLVIETLFTFVYPNIPGIFDKGVLAFTPDSKRVYLIEAGPFPQNVISVIDISDLCPSAIHVDIDIKPGSDPAPIDPKSNGRIPVAILTTDTFDATTVDPSTVRFGANGTEVPAVQSALEDVNSDGRTDMILQFNTQGTGIACGDTSALLTGETQSRQAITGTDAIQTVGCK
jgi:YVTN family beta-propeller protein